MKLILDTSAVIALRRGAKGIRKMLEERRNADEIGISRLTEYELALGARYLWSRHGDARELAWLDDLLDWVSVYEVDSGVVRNAAEVQASALGAGRPVPDMDLLIALSAGPGSELLTLDEDHVKMKEALGDRGVLVSSPP